MLEGPVRNILVEVLDPAGAGLDPACLDGATADMLDRIRIMPRYMGTGITCLTMAYGATGSRIDTWRRSRIGPLRDFVEFYEKMGTFVYYSHVEKRMTHP